MLRLVTAGFCSGPVCASRQPAGISVRAYATAPCKCARARPGNRKLPACDIDALVLQFLWEVRANSESKVHVTGTPIRTWALAGDGLGYIWQLYAVCMCIYPGYVYVTKVTCVRLCVCIVHTPAGSWLHVVVEGETDGQQLASGAA